MIIITGSTVNGDDGDLPSTTASEDDERQQHQLELVGYGGRNGSVGTLEETLGTALELSPVVEQPSVDEEELDDVDISGGDVLDEDQQFANGTACCQLELLEHKCTSDEEDALLVDGKLRNLISFCILSLGSPNGLVSRALGVGVYTRVTASSKNSNPEIPYHWRARVFLQLRYCAV
uniref:Uncharacterized protein n=1 Tax=Anopheles melas TaxID=34690 RepID=A0A182U866_9DIPT